MHGFGRKQKYSIISAILCLCMIINAMFVAYLPGFASTGEQLSGDEKLAYDALVPIIQQIACGERTSTVIVIGKNAADAEVKFAEHYSDFDLASLRLSLMRDLPFEMYWSNTKCSLSMTAKSSGTLLQATFKFGVASNYQGSASYTVDSAKAVNAAKAVKVAKQVVAQNAAKSDYQKLVAYRDYICEAVSYDDDAITSGNFFTNNDPWQLISVFDGNSKTNVVCEGYSKAFQLLCDLTAFEDESVACYMISGRIESSILNEEHCWNIVTLGGKNYLVDLANSESDTVGRNGGLFMVGSNCERSSNGYRFTVGSPAINVDFYYDEDTTSLWGDDVLKLASSDYKNASTNTSSAVSSGASTTVQVTEATPTETTTNVQNTVNTNPNTSFINMTSGHNCTYVWVKGNASDANGHTLTCEDCAKNASKTVAHTYPSKWTVTKAATCTASGEECRVCTTCGYKQTRKIAALGHSLTQHSAKAATESSIGWKAYVDCARCSYTTYSELPALAHTHSFGAWKELVPADCDSEGVDSRSCLICGYTENRTVNALGHDLVHVAAVDATCIRNGHNDYVVCTRCDYTTYEEVQAHGHTFGEWIVKVAPKCAVNGVERRDCTVCDHFEVREIEAICIKNVDYHADGGHFHHLTRDEEMKSSTLYHLC